MSVNTNMEVDNSKIQNELNWLPSVNFQDGLKELI